MSSTTDTRASLRWRVSCSSLGLVVGLLLTACHNETSEPEQIDPSGVYTLVMVDRQEVPTQVMHGEMSVEVRSGVFTIYADGTCRSQSVFVPPGRDAMTREVSATYTKDGAFLTMQWEGAGITTGTVNEETFTMDNEGMLFVYRK